jgi:ribosomal protein L11 methyltransferase
MSFIEIKVHCDLPFRDILIAEMGELEFDSFIETEFGFDAYIPEMNFNHPGLQQLFNNYRQQTKIWYELNKIAKQNWNAEWEKNYQPIEVGNDIRVRATFHDPQPNFKHEIIITPKMSFGTGHHETTHQMLALELGIDFEGKAVLDVGSGTGILAIMAAKLGANYLAATDIDEWCIENSKENFELNNVEVDELKLGFIQEFTFEKQFDIVLANINKNVLIEELPHYANLMTDNAHLFLSGFYKNDEADILELTKELGFEKIIASSKRDWTAILLKKV